MQTPTRVAKPDQIEMPDERNKAGVAERGSEPASSHANQVVRLLDGHETKAIVKDDNRKKNKRLSSS